MEQLALELVIREKEHRIRPPHVEQAMLEGNIALLSIFGRKGGINNGKIRRRKAEERKRIAALEKGTIEPPKKRRRKGPTKKELAALAARAEEARLQEIAVWLDRYHARNYRQMLRRDAKKHEKELTGGKCLH